MKTYPLHTERLQYYQMIKDKDGWSVVSRDGHVLVCRETHLTIAFRLAVLRSKIWAATN